LIFVCRGVGLPRERWQMVWAAPPRARISTLHESSVWKRRAGAADWLTLSSAAPRMFEYHWSTCHPAHRCHCAGKNGGLYQGLILQGYLLQARGAAAVRTEVPAVRNNDFKCSWEERCPGM
jgi:hypothetical protein